MWYTWYIIYLGTDSTGAHTYYIMKQEETGELAQAGFDIWGEKKNVLHTQLQYDRTLISSVFPGNLRLSFV